MFCVFNYNDEKWVSGIRKNAFKMCNNKYDALHFPSVDVAVHFLAVLKALYPDVLFSIIPFSE